ncbi:SNF2 family N-terminal domain-containing protein [Nemania sp. FL0031]|nr:SNF2 family N-terminal domain-containing protein [Nemania sp. FL0031]
MRVWWRARLSATIQHPNYLRVLVYSSKSHGNELGDLLFDHACFLQEPETYDEATTYHNPQWLTRPSREPDTSHTEKASLTVRNHSLSSAEKDKVDELFQSAIGPATFKKVEVSKLLNTELKDHQLKALSMMFEKESGLLVDLEFPSLWTERQDLNSSTPVYINTVSKSKQTTRPSLCRGGLLADEMGLGKTLTILALVVSSLDRDNAQIVTSLRPTLIVAPLSTLPNWEDQIKMHLKFQSVRFMIYHGTSRRKNHVSLKDSDIVLTTYDTLRADYSGPFPGNNNKGKRRKINDGMLHNITWKRVVLDEAHIIKNRNSQIFHAACKLEAQHRWCVTVTPIQNSVEDLGALIGFLRISPFDTPRRRNSMFWGRLKHLVQCISLRRTKESIGASLALPQRREIEHPVDLTSDERRIYDLTKRHFNQALDSGKPSLCTFNLLLRLRQVCNHGRDLLPKALQEWLDQALQYMDLFRRRSLSVGIFRVFIKFARAALALGIQVKESHLSFVGGRSSNYIPSSKVKALIQNLRCDDENQLRQGNPKPKSLVFSEWTSMLDLIGKALTRNGFTFQQLDGSLSLIQRRQTLFEFRNNPRCTVLLATLRCAGVGLDLTMASRVHLIEPGWNPMLERQALDRVHRLGQTKEVVSIRYIVQGSDSIEKVISRGI